MPLMFMKTSEIAVIHQILLCSLCCIIMSKTLGLKVTKIQYVQKLLGNYTVFHIFFYSNKMEIALNICFLKPYLKNSTAIVL